MNGYALVRVSHAQGLGFLVVEEHRFDSMRITMDLDIELAEQYHRAYLQRFGSDEEARLSLEDFLARFLGDRLSEELDFILETDEWR